MLEAFGTGFVTLFQPPVLLAMFVGVILGVVIGIIPGIGSIFGIAVLMPFVYRMPPETAMGFLVALASVTFTAGSIPAILLSIPGTALNVATMLDGFPMTRKGQGAQAIGAALTASMFGGVISAFLALLMMPLIVPMVMVMRTPELAVLILTGLVFMATLTGSSVLKGLISGFFGIALALVGLQGQTGTLRFTFGIVQLYEGINIVTLVLGIYGIGSLLEVMVLGQTTLSESPVKTPFKSMFQGARAVWHHKGIWFRSTVVGYLIGILPGVGGQLACFMAYGQAKQTSKHPEKFGTGVIEGVIAPESANNAKTGGDLLTTMAFGIPGAPDMAVMLGAFFMVGVVPGPSMMKEHLPLAFTLLWGVAFANIIATLICFATTPPLARIARVPISTLFPIILVVVVAGSFALKVSMFYAFLVLLFGVLGFLMTRFDYSRPALILGFVLGELFERYLFYALKLHGPFFFLTPISLVLIAIMILLFTHRHIKVLYRSLFRGNAKNA